MTAADETRRLLMEMGEQFAPLFEHADGIKADMERRGWSPTAAEAAALEVLLGMIRACLRVRS